MTRRGGRLTFATLLGLLGLSIGVVVPVSAAPPPTGVVAEGHAVPGVVLGATRAGATSTWGQPSYCRGATSSLCTHNLSSGATTTGSADLTFTGSGGVPATGGSTDIVASINWIAFPRWRTTAGVTTLSALWWPKSVVAAYPHAQIQRYGDGHLYSVTERHFGITVEWIPLTYSSQFYVQIQIFPGH